MQAGKFIFVVQDFSSPTWIFCKNSKSIYCLLHDSAYYMTVLMPKCI